MIDVLNFLSDHFWGSLTFIIVVGWVVEDVVKAARKRTP